MAVSINDKLRPYLDPDKAKELEEAELSYTGNGFGEAIDRGLTQVDRAITGAEQREAAEEAAKKQEQAALDAVELSRESRDINIERLDPFYQAGLGSLDEYLALSSPEGYAQFQTDYLTSEPYLQRKANVINDLSQSAAFGGTLGSGGAALDASNYLNQFAYDQADQAYTRQVAGLADQVGLGTFGVSGQIDATNQFTNQATTGLQNAAAAQGAAAMAAASPGLSPYLQLVGTGAQIYGATV
jgi:hypothetical protein